MDNSLIQQIFSPEKAKLLKELYEGDLSDSAKLSFKSYLSVELSKCDKIIVGNELNQIILLTSNASFCSDEIEPVTVGVMVFYCLKQTDVLPKITENQGKSLAARCLVSLSLFKPALKKLQCRYGAPSPEFYLKIGKAEFSRQGMENISKHFELWTNFLFEKFV